MASNPIPRTRADGTATFKVQWHEGKAQPSRTFLNRKAALEFKALVELGGRGNNRYPGDQIMRDRGLMAQLDGETAEVPSDPGVVTVDEAMTRYLAHRDSARQRRPTARTMKEYRSLQRNYITGTSVGDADVALVRSKQIQAWVNEQQTRPRRDRRDGDLSACSMNKVMAVLSGMFKWANMDLSDPDPAGETPLRALPSPMSQIPYFQTIAIHDKEKQVMRRGDYDLFFRCAYQVDPHWADMLVIAALAGMRFGECSAITVEQCDLNKGTISLDRRFTQGRLELGTKARRTTGREARIPLNVVEIVAARCKGKKKTALVFDGPEFSANKRWVASMDNYRWQKLDVMLTAAGLELRMRHHHLRHSFTTFLRDCGVEMQIIMGIIGHANATVTGRYLHITEEMWGLVMPHLASLTDDVMQIREAAYERFYENLRAGLPA